MNLILIYVILPIFSIITIFTTIIFLIPGQYFRFCTSWTALFFIWLWTAISQIAEKPERHLAYLWTIILLIVFSLILILRYQLLAMGIDISQPKKASDTNHINILKALNDLTFAAYGLMSVYLVSIVLNS
ncbi:MAG: hypothetical protein AAF298_04325 [Cyanobacteria bacterium P01_A01_bin.40]